MRGLHRAGLAGFGAALLVGIVGGHVHLRNPATGAQLEWSSPRVPIVIQLDGSDDIANLSDDAAIRMAIQDWNALEGSALVLVEDTDAEQRARRDWRSTKLHTILFDEDGSTGFFQGGGIVAVTTVSFLGGGRIRDADVLFNGRDHRFTTSGEFGAFDVQAIAGHELGHVAGFDHSGWSGSALFPYVEPNDLIARGLTQDELGAARSVYQSAAFGTISGSVARLSDGSAVSGAHVTARDEEGRPLRSVLSGPNGKFVLRGLDSGRYELYVSPLEGPVAELNLSGGQSIDTDFRALDDIGPIDVASGGSATAGLLFVEADGEVSLGRSWDSLPVRLVAGGTAGATLRGTGLVAGSTLEASDPDLVVQNVTWFGGSVTFRVAVPSDEPPGHVDLSVRAPDGEVSILTAALEITPVDPLVFSTEPSAASLSGGTQLVIRGANFREGSRVVIGDRIYREGIPGGFQLLDAETLTLTLLATVEGLHDIVVIDKSGVEGRLADGLLVDQRPVLATVFPRAGNQQGGTRVRITGSGFASDTRVLLDGVEQGGLQVFDAGRLEFVTSAGALGTRSLAVVDALGAGATTSFDLIAAADPELLLVDPGEGERAGGETIELAGSNLDPACRVHFGVDPDTGLGGAEAQVVEGGDGSRLVVVTPGLASTGPVSVSIEDPVTGQASLLNGGFFVRDESGGGGGACGSIGAPPRGMRGALEAAGWMLALFVLAWAWPRAELRLSRRGSAGT